MEPVSTFLQVTASSAATHMLYHMGMARKEILVQLDDDLVARLDGLAKKLGVSRSELLRRGASAVLEAVAIAEDDQALIDAYREKPQDPLLLEAAARLAATTTESW